MKLRALGGNSRNQSCLSIPDVLPSPSPCSQGTQCKHTWASLTQVDRILEDLALPLPKLAVGHWESLRSSF
jgi:hypothetical protein